MSELPYELKLFINVFNTNMDACVVDTSKVLHKNIQNESHFGFNMSQKSRASKLYNYDFNKRMSSFYY